MLVYDDVKIEFYNGKNQDKRIFHFWFHTSFIDSNGVFLINRQMTEQVIKDKKYKIYDRNFQVKVQMSKIGNYKMVDKQLPKMPRKIFSKKKKIKEKEKAK